MADNPLIPGSHGKPLNPDGSWRGEWWRFLRELSNQPGVSTELASQLNALAGRIQALEDADAPNLIGLLSVLVQGSFLSLRGDVANPGEAFYYGTDTAGEKGWYQRLLATLADVDLTGLADGDALVWDATAGRFIPGQPSTPQVFSRITAEGDVRITADGDIRITD